MTPIPTYVMNLRKRTDRKAHIFKEFAGRTEFDVHIVEAIERERGASGLWETLTHILQDRVDPAAEFILLCEDDHQFTGHYSKDLLFGCIAEARERKADVLCGGVSWFEDPLLVSERLFNLRQFSGLQFTILFKKFFPAILNAGFGPKDAADYRISDLSKSKFAIHPFISTQKEFGYSDVTHFNSQEGRVNELFSKSDEHFRKLVEVNAHYRDLPGEPENGAAGYNYDGIVLPVCVLTSRERAAGRQHIQQQFSGRNEFDITIVENHQPEGVGTWPRIREIVRAALENDEDLIVICGDDHTFTPEYSPEYLLRNVIGAHNRGAGLLCGGVTNYGHAVPITEHLFWINPFWSAPFIILYKKVFPLILNEPFDDTADADELLSGITSNKMLVFPFVSASKEVATEVGPVERLKALREAYTTFCRR